MYLKKNFHLLINKYNYINLEKILCNLIIWLIINYIISIFNKLLPNLKPILKLIKLSKNINFIKKHILVLKVKKLNKLKIDICKV